MKNTIYSRFCQQAQAQPDAVAVIDRNRRYTYAQVARMAHEIQTLFPVDNPRVVAVVMDHGVMMIASILAVLRSGAAYVPIEHSFPIERKRFMLNESQADFVITDHVRNLDEDVPELIIDGVVPTDGVSAEDYADGADPSSLAYVLYTSGTTGRPKGIMVEHANVCNYADAFAAEFDMKPGDVMLQHSVNTFDIFVEEVFATLLNGAALAIPGPRVRNDVSRLMDFVDKRGVTVISGFPYLLQDIDRHGRLPRSVRLLISGGDVLRHSYISHLKDKAVIYNTYGPSETTVCATYQRCDDIDPLPDGTYPIGHPVKGVKVEILDEDLNPVADGEVGEICISGAGVSRGYIGDRPEQANFVKMPDGRRLYRSGDMGRTLPDGTVSFLHRKDSQVMILGKRVECGEVENVLCECPEVDSAAVRPVVDGQGLAHLIAYVVPRSAKAFSLSAIKERMARSLAAFMMPETFVRLKAMPLTPNGKVDDKMLPHVDPAN